MLAPAREKLSWQIQCKFGLFLSQIEARIGPPTATVKKSLIENSPIAPATVFANNRRYARSKSPPTGSPFSQKLVA
jgi:hypothetical protein